VAKASTASSKSALRRQREREERLKIILGAAESFFAAEGYHQTSMERIADEAEVSVGSLYVYFKNKEDLLIKLLDDIGFELRELLGQAFAESGIGFDGLRRASEVFFNEFCRNNPGKIAIIFRESVGQSEVVEEHRKRIFEKLITDLDKALAGLASREGLSFRTDESRRIMAASILGTYERLAYHYLIWTDQPERLETVARDAADFIIGGIRALAS
jgi:AcrR family transcriptional regulator